MPVWRDTWDGDSQVVVIAPGPASGGAIRQAMVFLNEAQRERTVTLTDSFGQPVTVDLPPDLLDGERRNVETFCTLSLKESP